MKGRKHEAVVAEITLFGPRYCPLPLPISYVLSLTLDITFLQYVVKHALQEDLR